MPASVPPEISVPTNQRARRRQRGRPGAVDVDRRVTGDHDDRRLEGSGAHGRLPLRRTSCTPARRNSAGSRGTASRFSCWISGSSSDQGTRCGLVRLPVSRGPVAARVAPLAAPALVLGCCERLDVVPGKHRPRRPCGRRAVPATTRSPTMRSPAPPRRAGSTPASRRRCRPRDGQPGGRPAASRPHGWRSRRGSPARAARSGRR